MTSIVDVAREANVSPSTVSRVIRGDRRIGSTTRERVSLTIKQMGYQARPAGRPRKTARQWNMGVLYSPRMVVCNELISLCRDWIGAIREATIQASGHLEIMAGARSAALDPIYQHTLDRHELHGVILLGANPQDGYLQDLTQRQVPAVMMNRRSQAGEFSSVFADLRGGARLAVEHLIGLGHRRIAMIGLPPDTSWTAYERYHGAMQALREHGLSPVLDRQVSASFDDTPSFEQGCDQLMASSATAVIAGDFAGVRYADLLQERGMRVPQDISIIGFDHVGLTSQAGQKLTSITYDKQRMGHLAVAMLTKLIRNRKQLSHLEASVPTSLADGDTTARPCDTNA